MSDSMGKKTPFYNFHIENDAKMVDFNGWALPLQYSGIIDEVKATRKTAAIFDVSHMGEILVEGEGARDFLQKLLTNDICNLDPGRIQYTLMCYKNGGVVDDLILYCLDENKFWLVVNAANKEKDLNWIKENSKGKENLSIIDESEYTAQIALQGPKSEVFLHSLLDRNLGSKLSELGYFRFDNYIIDGREILISRTGYTGEDGFELYLQSREAEKVWNNIMEAGKDFKLAPAGLGARDVLRIEAGLPLYGHEISENITPLEAGLFIFVKLNTNFIGKEVLIKQKEEGVKRKKAGFVLEGKRPPREGYELYCQGNYIGKVTSGTYSPTLEKPIGMGLINPNYTRKGTEIEIKIRKKSEKAKVVNLPFI